jgi:thioredoxin reductase
MKNSDAVIIGAGPAGLAYAGHNERANVKRHGVGEGRCCGLSLATLL